MGGRLNKLDLPSASENGISAPVGQAASNQESDVYIVQMLLNAVPEENGGPRPKLLQDGLIGSKTLDAIRVFQEHQFGQGAVDGRVDPDGRTLSSLMSFASREIQAEIKGIRRTGNNLGGRLRIPRPPKPGSKLEIGIKEQELPK